MGIIHIGHIAVSIVHTYEEQEPSHSFISIQPLGRF